MKTTPYSPSATVILLCLGLLAEVTPSAIASESEALTSDRPTIAAAAAERSAKRDQLLREADKAAKDRKKEVGEVESALRYEEGKKKLLAELLDDGPINRGAFSLASELRADPSYSSPKRVELARLLQLAERKGRRFANREEWAKQCEKDALLLVRDFPNEPSAHEGLLQAAVISSGPRSRVLARWILNSSAPDSVKQAAAVLLERQNIEGKNFQAVLSGIEGTDQLSRSAQGKRVIFYTWAPEDQRSVTRALEITRSVAGNAIIIGVNLGPDAAQALRAASQFGLPGQQIYGARGHDSPLVRRLHLTSVGLIYAVESDGTLKNLSGERDLGKALAKLN